MTSELRRGDPPMVPFRILANDNPIAKKRPAISPDIWKSLLYHFRRASLCKRIDLGAFVVLLKSPEGDLFKFGWCSFVNERNDFNKPTEIRTLLEEGWILIAVGSDWEWRWVEFHGTEQGRPSDSHRPKEVLNIGHYEKVDILTDEGLKSYENKALICPYNPRRGWERGNIPPISSDLLFWGEWEGKKVAWYGSMMQLEE